MKNKTDKKTEIIFLGYHYLKRDDEYKRIYGCSFDLFKQQIDFLMEKFPPVSLKELTSFLDGKGELPPRCSLIFFDDGLIEHARVFAPYLAERKISAIFSPPACIFDKKMTEVQIIHFLSSRYGIKQFYTELKKHFPVTGLVWGDYFSEETESLPLMSLYKKIKDILLHTMPAPARDKLLDVIYKEVLLKNDPDIFEKVYMSKNDLSDIAAMGHTVGCHSYSHFSSLKPGFCKNEWKKEIEEPKELLERITGGEVDIFVHPYGRKVKEEFDLKGWTDRLKKTGFRYAVNTYREFEGEDELDPFWIEKYSVHSEDSSDDIIKNAHRYKI